MISVFKKIYQGFRSPHLALGYAMDKYQCSVDKKIHIPYLVVITGQKCTLRCKDCGNFTPYLPQTHYNINDLCDDINKFSSVARITLLQIQGGEALIFPMFKELLNIVGGRQDSSRLPPMEPDCCLKNKSQQSKLQRRALEYQIMV